MSAAADAANHGFKRAVGVLLVLGVDRLVRQRAGHGAVSIYDEAVGQDAHAASAAASARSSSRNDTASTPSDCSTPTMTCSKPADTTVVGTFSATSAFSASRAVP